MRTQIRESVALLITLAGLIGIPIWVFGYQESLRASDRRVVPLTGVMKDGAWTTAWVTALNYGAKRFTPAEIDLEEGEEVLFHLSSADVTHGFYVPELGIGPVVVNPGHDVEIAFDADTTGSFSYYCTMVCGECHHYMRGWIHIGREATTAAASPSNEWGSCAHHLEVSFPSSSLTDRGRDLFERKGCRACHGPGGRGGVRNPNYIKGTVPGLDSLAERMYLYDPEDVEAILGLLEDGVDLDAEADDPPFRSYQRFLAQYESVHSVIRDGKPAGRRDTTGVHPPLNMPSWEAELSDSDIDAIIAYLLATFPWDAEDR